MKTKANYRSFSVSQEDLNIDERTLKMTFSSETEEVERDFGIEILGHGEGEFDLQRLNEAAPVLVDHERKDQVGVVLKANINAERKGEAVLKFSRSKRGEDIMNDVADGIRKNVSIGYVVRKLQKIEDRVFRAIDWFGFEISFSSIAADNSVGVGRDMKTEYETEVIEKEEKEPNTEMVASKKGEPNVEIEVSTEEKYKSVNEKRLAMIKPLNL